MQAIIILLLFVGMFLVVQSVYEDRVRVIEKDYKKRQQEWTPRMYEPAERRGNTGRKSWDASSEAVGISSLGAGDEVEYSPADFTA